MTALTAVGSVLSTLLSMPLAPIVSHVFPKAVALTRSTLEGGDALVSPRGKSPVWVRLSVLRLVGVVPWSGINIACGVASVALFDCLLGAFIGTLPWTVGIGWGYRTDRCFDIRIGKFTNYHIRPPFSQCCSQARDLDTGISCPNIGQGQVKEFDWSSAGTSGDWK